MNIYFDNDSFRKLLKIKKYVIDNSLIKKVSFSSIIKYLIEYYYNNKIINKQ